MLQLALPERGDCMLLQLLLHNSGGSKAMLRLGYTCQACSAI